MYMFVGPRLRQLMPNGHSVTEYVRHRFGTGPFVAISAVIIFVMGIFITAEMTAITTDLFPLWMHFLMLVSGLMLAMSTLDTLMNGLATDLAGMGVSRGALMLQARAVTAVLAVPAIIVASQGFSVLYVFLVADLLGAAIAVPMLVGLYSAQMPGWAVLLAGGAGIIVGALFYPKPDLVSPMILSAPSGEQMFWSFLLALAVSSAITAGVVLLRRVSSAGEEYDFARLASEVQLIDEQAPADDQLTMVGISTVRHIEA